jgi:large subunit ribosomal protein L3
MGGTAHRTVQNLRVLRIDERDSTLLVSGAVPGPEGGILTLVDAKKALVGAAANAWAKGKTLSGELATGKEAMDVYLKNGLTQLPFPAATKEMVKGWPKVVEVGELQ